MKKNYWFDKDIGTFTLNNADTGKYWYNHLWNKDGYHCAVSHVGHGNSRYVSEDGKIVMLTQDEQRYFYIRDEDKFDFWNIGISPTMVPVENYRCEHGMEYTKISSERNGIKASWLFSVPEKGTYEIWQITIENTCNRTRELSLFPYIKFDLSGYPQPFYYNSDTTSETLFLNEINGIIDWSKNPFQPHERCSGFLASSEKVIHYDGWLEKFNGAIGNSARPDILVNGKNCTDSQITVRERGAVLQNKVELAPGEVKTIYYIAGLSIDSKTVVKECTEAFKTAESVCLNSVERGVKRFSSLRVNTPDERINNIMNFWNQKQVEFCSIGKKAVRDNAQIVMGMLNFNSDLAESSMIECLSHQYADGHAMLLWSPFIDEHLYSDPPMWLVLSVCEVIKETGDIKFLDYEAPFFDKGSASVYEHLKRAINWLVTRTGPNGISRIFYADWNDALNIPDENAESIFMAMGVSWALNEMASLAEVVEDIEYKNELLERRKRLVDTINKVAWNGDYYVRALSKFGKIGDKDSPVGGNIYINPQTWAILGEVVPDEYRQKLFDSIDDMDTDYGIPLCKPRYEKYYDVVGRMSGMLPGVYENGGIYHHACGFKVFADCKAGRKEEALQSLKKMIPDGEHTPSSITTTEPYVFTNCYLMHESTAFLLVGFSWQTGTSAWALRSFYEGILGLKRTYKGLQIKPQLPNEWKSTSAKRIFRGCEYNIEYVNNGGTNIQITVDGDNVDGDILPLFNDGKVHDVLVVIS
jgi:cellobiose phosphorylase